MPAQLQHEVRNSPLEMMLNVEVHAFYRHKYLFVRVECEQGSDFSLFIDSTGDIAENDSYQSKQIICFFRYLFKIKSEPRC